MQVVIKRDGSTEGFDKSAIVDAITSAMSDVGRVNLEVANRIADEIVDRYRGIVRVDIHEIQSLVEHKLMCSKHKDAAKAYIEYRRDRDNVRELKSDLIGSIQGLMGGTDDSIMKENANKDSHTIPTKRDLLAGLISKHYALNHILPKHIANAHISGDIHYHDLDYAPFGSSFNCMLIDVEGMLANGFRLGNAELASPRSITTATAVVAQIIAQVASHIYGGNTINGIDTILEKYVEISYGKHLAIGIEEEAKDPHAYALRRTEKECYDAFQSLEYEVNTLHTANGQTPFCTFGFGLGTSRAARMIQRSILQVRIDGLGTNGHTAVFPKLVFGIKDGVNHKPTDPNYDIKQLALECSSKRLYPDILNYDMLVKNTGSFKYPMGCRSYLNPWKDENGVEVHSGRNNLGVVTLNLPRIAIQANGDIEEFYRILQERMVICRQALMTRVERLEKVQAKEAPILYIEGACGVRLKPDDYVGGIFKNGRASISMGYLGVHEAVNALFSGDHIFHNGSKQAFARNIMTTMKKFLERCTAETGYAFSLYGTPAESLCYRFLKLDREEFGIIPGVTDKEFYTNSFHLDVEKNANPYDKIDFEKQFAEISTGGFICYGEFPNMQHNLKALEDVWDYSYLNVPYYGTNTPADTCFKCGFHGEFNATAKGFTCPKCGNHEYGTMNVIRRVCGYLGNADERPFNDGKMDEVSKRVKHIG